MVDGPAKAGPYIGNLRIRQSANPPIRESANPRIRESANPPIRESANLPVGPAEAGPYVLAIGTTSAICESANPPIRESANPSICQSSNPRICESAIPRIYQSTNLQIERQSRQSPRVLRAREMSFSRPNAAHGIMPLHTTARHPAKSAVGPRRYNSSADASASVSPPLRPADLRRG